MIEFWPSDPSSPLLQPCNCWAGQRNHDGGTRHTGRSRIAVEKACAPAPGRGHRAGPAGGHCLADGDGSRATSGESGHPGTHSQSGFDQPSLPRWFPASRHRRLLPAPEPRTVAEPCTGHQTRVEGGFVSLRTEAAALMTAFDYAVAVLGPRGVPRRGVRSANWLARGVLVVLLCVLVGGLTAGGCRSRRGGGRPGWRRRWKPRCWRPNPGCRRMWRNAYAIGDDHVRNSGRRRDDAGEPAAL
jgi:hypothetical protein